MCFYKTPYIGQNGWVSLKAGGPLDWTEIRHLVTESYRLVQHA
jgi:predicted DNA-binding protein (MmcQ/YjbR family)